MLTAPRCSASLLLAVALVVAGCTADAGGGASSSAATTSAAPRSTAAEGYPVFAAEDVQEARLRLPGGPDWLAVAEDGVWLKRDDSTLDRLDPDTGRSALSVELGGGLCQGVGAGLGAVWACRDTDVVPASGAVVSTIALGARGTDLGAGPAGLWVASQPDGQVLRVDPDAGTVAVRATGLDRPLAVAVTDQVWAGGSDTTVRLDPTTGAVQVTAAIGIGLDGGIAAGAGAVFLRNGERFLVRLDASTGAPVSGVSADVESAGDVVVAFGSVWTTASDDAALFRLPAG